MLDQKFMKGSVATNLLGSFLLLGGLGAGMVLISQPQNFGGKAKSIDCMADTVVISESVNSYMCTADGNVARVALVNDPDPNCQDYKAVELVEFCKPVSAGNVTYNNECRMKVKAGQIFLGKSVKDANVKLYPGGVGCVPISKLVVR